jgi:hypothetical protein
MVCNFFQLHKKWIWWSTLEELHQFDESGAISTFFVDQIYGRVGGARSV